MGYISHINIVKSSINNQQKTDYGGRSSVGRAPDCDSGCRGFEPHRPPHLNFDLFGEKNTKPEN